MNTYGAALITRLRTEQAIEITLPNFTYINPSCDPNLDVCIPVGPPVQLPVPAELEVTGVGLQAPGESRVIEAGLCLCLCLCLCLRLRLRLRLRVRASGMCVCVRAYT